MLLGASLLFYSLWIPSYLVLLLIEIGVNHLLLRGIRHSTRPKLYLAASIVFTLGVLVWFKYAALLVETVLPFLPSGLGANVAIPDIFLPLGISFYSFQIIALAVDTHREPEAPLPSLARYALFVSFFPQLIAGPILRGRQFLPQLQSGGRPTSRRTRRGLWLIGAGLLKKVVLADFLLAPFVDEVFAAPGVASAPYHWMAIYSFSFQIYFDFSGYTDMARGLALLLGFEIPANFREPYMARNPTEFWRSWHITLSRWLRDYLYIPLGGNRRGSARTYVNLGLTMLLGGLWHGAGFTFVVWGGLHGLLLGIHRRWGRQLPEEPGASLSWRDVLRIAACFQAVCVLWVFFRVASLEDAGLFLRGLFFGGEFHSGWPILQAGVVALCIGLHPLERAVREALPKLQRMAALRPWPAALEGIAAGALLAMVVAASSSSGAFIYFQF